MKRNRRSLSVLLAGLLMFQMIGNAPAMNRMVQAAEMTGQMELYSDDNSEREGSCENDEEETDDRLGRALETEDVGEESDQEPSESDAVTDTEPGKSREETESEHRKGEGESETGHRKAEEESETEHREAEEESESEHRKAEEESETEHRKAEGESESEHRKGEEESESGSDPDKQPMSREAELLQEQIDELPTILQYDYLTRKEKEEAKTEAGVLKEIYYEELDDQERESVDAARLFALDLYSISYAYYGNEEEYPGKLDLPDVKTVSQSRSQILGLQAEIDALPGLEEVVALPADENQIVAYGDSEVKLSSEELAVLYEDVYDAAATFYVLPEEQTMEGDSLPALTAFFSTGVAAYAAKEDVGRIVEYNYNSYSGSMWNTSLHFGYYKVNTDHSQGDALAFCMDSLDWSPGGVGTRLYSETECTSKVIRTILYYGYGGPGELVSHDKSGYCETHMAICYALDDKSSNNGFGQAAYNKLYTNVKDKSVYAYVKAWMVSTGVSGTQPLVYAIFTGTGSLKKLNSENEKEVLAGAKYQVYVDRDCKVKAETTAGKNALFTTTAEGSNEIPLYPGTYYVKETRAPEGFLQNEKVYSLRIRKGEHRTLEVKDVPYGMVVTAKRGAQTKEPLAGAVYRVYEDKDCTTLRKDIYGHYSMTTTTDGSCSDMLYYPSGSRIYVKEYKAPTGTIKDPAVYPVDIQAGRIAFADGSSVRTIKDTNIGWLEDTEYGKVSIYKIDAVNGMVVAGAKYRFYTDKACKSPAKTVTGRNAVCTTTASGSNTCYMKLNTTYYVKEIYAPQGYKLSPEIMKMKVVKRGDTYVLQAEDMPGDEPGEGTIPLELIKRGVDGDMQEEEDASDFEGAIFALEFRAQNANAPEADRIWYYRTDENGMLKTDDESYLVDSFYMEGMTEEAIFSDPLEHGTDGRVQFPVGYYRIREVAPPAYYTLDGTMSFVLSEIRLLADNPQLQTDSVTAGLRFELQYDPVTGKVIALADGIPLGTERILVETKDEVHHCILQVNKKGSNGEPLAGVCFRLEQTDGDTQMTTLISEQTTDRQGCVSWDQLLPGDYVLTEISTVKGYELLRSSIKIQLPYRLSQEELDSGEVDPDQVWYDEVNQCYMLRQVCYEITDRAELKLPMAGGTPWIVNHLPILLWILVLGWILRGYLRHHAG